MPTVADLERLDALVKRLVPLADVQRGELIQAQQWNLVVGALIEVARAVLAEEREGHVAAHGHPDQVTPGWLDPRLRTLVERGAPAGSKGGMRACARHATAAPRSPRATWRARPKSPPSAAPSRACRTRATTCGRCAKRWRSFRPTWASRWR